DWKQRLIWQAGGSDRSWRRRRVRPPAPGLSTLAHVGREDGVLRDHAVRIYMERDGGFHQPVVPRLRTLHVLLRSECRVSGSGTKRKDRVEAELVVVGKRVGHSGVVYVDAGAFDHSRNVQVQLATAGYFCDDRVRLSSGNFDSVMVGARIHEQLVKRILNN